MRLQIISNQKHFNPFMHNVLKWSDAYELRHERVNN